MSLTKQTVIDQITVQENGIVLYREATRISIPANVVAICNAAWTTEVIAAYQAAQAAAEAARNANT